MNIPALAAGLFSGIIGSMGLGGGAVLIIYLDLFTNTGQLKARGINLIFFIPIAAVAVTVYALKKQIHWKQVLLLSVCGLTGAAVCIFLTGFIKNELLGKLFGAALIIFGVKEIFSKSVKKVAEKEK